MSAAQAQSQVGIGLPGLVFLVFLVSKVAGLGLCATWSWCWVTAPLWVPAGLVLAACLLAAIVSGLASLLKLIRTLRKHRRAYLRRAAPLRYTIR